MSDNKQDIKSLFPDAPNQVLLEQTVQDNTAFVKITELKKEVDNSTHLGDGTIHEFILPGITFEEILHSLSGMVFDSFSACNQSKDMLVMMHSLECIKSELYAYEVKSLNDEMHRVVIDIRPESSLQKHLQESLKTYFLKALL
jgi:hypothetical protein